MAAHRKLDRSRVYLCGAALRKRVGGANCAWAGGSTDISPFSDNQTQSEANAAWAFPSAGEITVCMEARLSASAIIVKPIEGPPAMAYAL
jgi:hypothetical protein